MEIIQRFIPASNTETRPGIKMVPKYITIHETDNTSPGADAVAHARLQESGNSRQASWHVQVDDKEAIQSIPFNEVAWAAGDGSNGPGNLTSIHIEICVNADGDYKKAVSNAAEVTRQLMKQFNIQIANVVQHNHWSGKDCPHYLRSGERGITWNNFVDMLRVEEEPKAKYGDKGVGALPLQVGSKNDGVRIVHQQLAALGYIQQADKDRDIYDNWTAGKIKQFQKDQLMKETGVYDYLTALQFAKVLAVYHKNWLATKH